MKMSMLRLIRLLGGLFCRSHVYFFHFSMWKFSVKMLIIGVPLFIWGSFIWWWKMESFLSFLVFLLLLFWLESSNFIFGYFLTLFLMIIFFFCLVRIFFYLLLYKKDILLLQSSFCAFFSLSLSLLFSYWNCGFS